MLLREREIDREREKRGEEKRLERATETKKTECKRKRKGVGESVRNNLDQAEMWEEDRNVTVRVGFEAGKVRVSQHQPVEADQLGGRQSRDRELGIGSLKKILLLSSFFLFASI